MNTWNKKVMLLAGVSAALAAGCQTDVPKDDMDAIGKWSIAMCGCAEQSGAEAKNCAAALKQPSLDRSTSSGRPKFKLDSILTYDQIAGTGEACERKIPK